MNDCVEGCVDSKEEVKQRPQVSFKCVEIKFDLDGKEIIVTKETMEKYGLSTWQFDRHTSDDDIIKAILFSSLNVNIQ